MADENHQLRSVSWTELFSFTHIFKSFRMAAISPSKLILAFAAIALVYLVGWVLDGVWGWAGQTACENEIELFIGSENAGQFEQNVDKVREEAYDTLARSRAEIARGAHFLTPFKDQYRRNRGSGSSPFGRQLDEEIKAMRKGVSVPKVMPVSKVRASVDSDWADVWDNYEEIVEQMLADATDVIDKAKDGAARKVKEAEDKDKAEAQLASDLNAARQALWRLRVDMLDQLEVRLAGRGLSSVLLHYENQCVAGAFSAVRRGDLFTGLEAAFQNRRATVAAVERKSELQRQLAGAQAGGAEPAGLLVWIMLMFYGPIWLLSTHTVYAVIFGLLALSIWALFGGAVARMAAVHAAREETISIGQALRFSSGKFFSFLTAPLVLPIVIGVVGVIMGLGGLLLAVPYLDIILSPLFIIALALGMVVTFLGIGFVAGLPLMYPTIAIEGSDSFDAISRSMTYVFQRPWRYGLYSLVTAVYGTICYLFIRLCAFGTLLATYYFVSHGLFGLGMSVNDAPELANGASKMDLFLVRPTFFQLGAPMQTAAMSGGDYVVGFFIRAWTYLVIGMVGAFVLTFAVCSFTNIYYLLRRKVDATDLDDVYIEELEEELPAEISAEQPAEQPAEEPAEEPAEPQAEGEGEQAEPETPAEGEQGGEEGQPQ